MLDQLAGDHFTFAVGVRRDDQFPSFTQQALDRLELAGGLALDLHLPLLRDDRQVCQHPTLVAGVVGVRRCGLQQVADAPGDRDGVAQPAAVATTRGAEDLGDVLCLGRFFAEKQPHENLIEKLYRGLACQTCRHRQALCVWMYSL